MVYCSRSLTRRHPTRQYQDHVLCQQQHIPCIIRSLTSSLYLTSWYFLRSSGLFSKPLPARMTALLFNEQRFPPCSASMPITLLFSRTRSFIGVDSFNSTPSSRAIFISRETSPAPIDIAFCLFSLYLNPFRNMPTTMVKSLVFVKALATMRPSRI